MKVARENCLGRLVFGSVLNAGLLVMMPRVAGWSSVEREFRLVLLAAALGSTAIICVLPVLWRAKDPVRVVALLLLILPVLTFWLVWDFVTRYQ